MHAHGLLRHRDGRKQRSPWLQTSRKGRWTHEIAVLCSPPQCRTTTASSRTPARSTTTSGRLSPIRCQGGIQGAKWAHTPMVRRQILTEGRFIVLTLRTVAITSRKSPKGAITELPMNSPRAPETKITSTVQRFVDSAKTWRAVIRSKRVMGRPLDSSRTGDRDQHRSRDQEAQHHHLLPTTVAMAWALALPSSPRRRGGVTLSWKRALDKF